MNYQVFDNKLVIRLDSGDEILECIIKVCEKEKVYLASISGIGAARYIEANILNVPEKEYITTVFEGFFEITSLTGNITTIKNKVFPHIHATWSDFECKAHGGHLSRGIISATGEIIITKLEGAIERRPNPALGITEFDLGGN